MRRRTRWGRPTGAVQQSASTLHPTAACATGTRARTRAGILFFGRKHATPVAHRTTHAPPPRPAPPRPAPLALPTSDVSHDPSDPNNCMSNMKRGERQRAARLSQLTASAKVHVGQCGLHATANRVVLNGHLHKVQRRRDRARDYVDHPPSGHDASCNRARSHILETDLGAFALPFVSTGAAVVPAASSSAGKANGRKPAGRQRRHSVHHGCLVLSV